MHALIQAVENKHRKSSVPQIKSGDTVRVAQKIQEGGKTRTQVFEGMVIRTRRQQSLTNSVTVRRVASGVGVEKTFMIHHPSIVSVEIVRRSKVRRNYLTYMRKRTGKSARLSAVSFDRDDANKPTQVQEEEKPKESKKTDKAEQPVQEAKQPKADKKESEEKKSDK